MTRVQVGIYKSLNIRCMPESTRFRAVFLVYSTVICYNPESVNSNRKRPLKDQ